MPIWVPRRIYCNNIVLKTQTGKLMMSAAKSEIIPCKEQYHLGQLRCHFRPEWIQDYEILYVDMVHDVIHLQYKRTLAFHCHAEIKYADDISGDVGMVLLVTLSGLFNAYLGPSFKVSENRLSFLPNFQSLRQCSRCDVPVWCRGPDGLWLVSKMARWAKNIQAIYQRSHKYFFLGQLHCTQTLSVGDTISGCDILQSYGPSRSLQRTSSSRLTLCSSKPSKPDGRSAETLKLWGQSRSGCWQNHRTDQAVRWIQKDLFPVIFLFGCLRSEW